MAVSVSRRFPSIPSTIVSNNFFLLMLWHDERLRARFFSLSREKSLEISQAPRKPSFLILGDLQNP